VSKDTPVGFGGTGGGVGPAVASADADGLGLAETTAAVAVAVGAAGMADELGASDGSTVEGGLRGVSLGSGLAAPLPTQPATRVAASPRTRAMRISLPLRFIGG
jgi:hypothetical protein